MSFLFSGFQVSSKIIMGLSLWFALWSNAIWANGVLRFATEATYPPFVNLNDKGQVSGFETDILRTICTRQKLTCTFVSQPFDSLIPGLKTGKFDAIYGGISITPVRQKQIDFSDSLYKLKTALLVKKTSAIQKIDAASLKNETIGVQEGTTFLQYMRTSHHETGIKSYPSSQEALMDLDASRISGVLADTAVLTHWMRENPNNAYRLMDISEEDRPFFGEGYGVGFRKAELRHREIINAGLAELKKEGIYEELLKKYPGL